MKKGGENFALPITNVSVAPYSIAYLLRFFPYAPAAFTPSCCKIPN